MTQRHRRTTRLLLVFSVAAAGMALSLLTPSATADHGGWQRFSTDSAFVASTDAHRLHAVSCRGTSSSGANFTLSEGRYVQPPGTRIYFNVDESTSPEGTSVICEGTKTHFTSRRCGFFFQDICWTKVRTYKTTVFSHRYLVDRTPPTLQPTITPSPVIVGGPATADPGATDGVSGVSFATCGFGADLETEQVGWYRVLCKATDRAGNNGFATLDYQVVYDVDGFAAPVDMEAVNQRRAGGAVPLRFSVSDANGTPITGLGAADVDVTAATLACDLGETPDLAEEAGAGDSGLVDHGDGQYSFMWQTPKEYAGSCKTAQLRVADGPPVTADFAFRG